VSASDPSALYLRDLGVLLKEMALKAKAEADASEDTEDRAYAQGRLMALHEVVSLMQQQATAFELDLSDLGLDGIEPERDLL
jgi:hypothetical protein